MDGEIVFAQVYMYISSGVGRSFALGDRVQNLPHISIRYVLKHMHRRKRMGAVAPVVPMPMISQILQHIQCYTRASQGMGQT